MPDLCKVVIGSCAMGFKDVSGPLPYKMCVDYLNAHIDQIGDEEDPHYNYGLDIVNVETGRLMSYVLR